MNTDADTVFISEIVFEANHGYTDEEQKTKRRFQVSVEMALPLSDASYSDVLEDTVDYWKISQLVLKIGTENTFRLVERLAGEIGRALQLLYPMAAITVFVDKLNPPCPGQPTTCGVRMIFARKQ